jgi:hypothetical protein
MIHVLVASTLPLLWFFTQWARRGRRTSVRSLTMLAAGCVLSGTWAVTPDLPRLFGKMELYVELHHRSYCNVWWFHCAIDAHDAMDSSMIFPAVFVLVAIAVVAIAWRELATLEAEHKR